jgi:chemotaxis protein CheX
MTDTTTSAEPPRRDNLSAMRADFINPFITSTVRVVSAMSGIQPVAQRPRLKQDLRVYADVTGLIGLMGEGVEGTLAISFEAPCILRVVSNMLGAEVNALNHEIEDAVGELTNTISGAARADLESRGYSFRLAVPSVITRTGQKFTTTLRSPVVQVPFQTDFGAFFVEAGLNPTAG